ncbi:sensor domain-containing diguanylate cyclase [Aquibacillus albus]|uniref:Diguanylate cyclase (GGDEF)-like protein n=1 Tax=Aquibacillus albus TaxID=1168171 RepID=A0ABS2N4P9_9BACI|nr:sensor domain-containing diguanylate cyclase [Aquibacillus albus]MBM7572850.1 diguanylate cyclase (GGDEF)-like protein [Aquibacillus albus]
MQIDKNLSLYELRTYLKEKLIHDVHDGYKDRVVTEASKQMNSDCSYELRQLESLAVEVNNVLKELGSFSKTKEKANKYELLYRVTRKFHSSINTRDVLIEIIKTLSEVYPEFKCKLLLSQDYKDESELPIQELIYNDEFVNKSSVQAFLTGEVKFERNNKKNKSRLFAPLKGRQGIYGVLHVTAPNTLTVPASDVEFITLLANTAGNALENARLYQQSKQVIADLQLINETSHKLNSNLRLSETTNFMYNQIKESFGAEEVGFFLFKEHGYELLDGSTRYFSEDGAASILTSILPLLERDKESLFIGDFSVKHPSVPYRSIMAIPMVQSNQTKGAIIVLHQTPYFFSFESFKLFKSLVHHSTLAFVNSSLREQLEKLVITDYLTKLYSRKYLDEKLQEHQKVDNHGALLLIDIDDFKQLNDTFGHDTGDEVIIQVANILENNVGEKAFAARWGGEEFAVYLPHVTITDGVETANQILNQVRTNTIPKVTVSIGVSYWQAGKIKKVKTIFECADEALYEAKRSGKNCVATEKRMTY